jgi:prepilin-type N-terminal cleavage/methylation domain-containing protein
VESRCLIQRDRANGLYGFTLIEVLVVVVIIVIAAVMAVPLMSSAESVQLRSAANLIAADLEYAKNLAITRQQYYTVDFDKDAESYEIQDQSGTVIPHPVNKGFDYSINFTNNSRLKEVDIYDVDFDSVTFDYLGSPDVGGDITLKAGNSTMTITVAMVTGYVSIN